MVCYLYRPNSQSPHRHQPFQTGTSEHNAGLNLNEKSKYRWLAIPSQKLQELALYTERALGRLDYFTNKASSRSRALENPPAAIEQPALLTTDSTVYSPFIYPFAQR